MEIFNWKRLDFQEKFHIQNSPTFNSIDCCHFLFHATFWKERIFILFLKLSLDIFGASVSGIKHQKTIIAVSNWPNDRKNEKKNRTHILKTWINADAYIMYSMSFVAFRNHRQMQSSSSRFNIFIHISIVYNCASNIIR